MYFSHKYKLTAKQPALLHSTQYWLRLDFAPMADLNHEDASDAPNVLQIILTEMQALRARVETQQILLNRLQSLQEPAPPQAVDTVAHPPDPPPPEEDGEFAEEDEVSLDVMSPTQHGI